MSAPTNEAVTLSYAPETLQGGWLTARFMLWTAVVLASVQCLGAFLGMLHFTEAPSELWRDVRADWHSAVMLTQPLANALGGMATAFAAGFMLRRSGGALLLLMGLSLLCVGAAAEVAAAAYMVTQFSQTSLMNTAMFSTFLAGPVLALCIFASLGLFFTRTYVRAALANR